MKPWRIRVRHGYPMPGELAFYQETVFFLPDRYWTKPGAWRAADRWKADYERRRVQYTVMPSSVLVDVVHRREVPS